MSFLILLSLPFLSFAQSNSAGCNSACMNYLTELENEKNIVNAAVWDYSGPVTANQISTVCGLGNPLACCDCGGTGITGNESAVLAAWALTCNTFNTVQDGGASAVECWTSHFHQGCVDYDNLLEGGVCGSSSSGGSGNGGGNGGNESGSASGAQMSSTPSGGQGTTTTLRSVGSSTTAGPVRTTTSAGTSAGTNVGTSQTATSTQSFQTGSATQQSGSAQVFAADDHGIVMALVIAVVISIGLL